MYHRCFVRYKKLESHQWSVPIELQALLHASSHTSELDELNKVASTISHIEWRNAHHSKYKQWHCTRRKILVCHSTYLQSHLCIALRRLIVEKTDWQSVAKILRFNVKFKNHPLSLASLNSRYVLALWATFTTMLRNIDRSTDQVPQIESEHS